MSQGFRLAGVAGLVVLAIGLVIYGSVPSAGAVLVVIGLIVLTGLAFVTNARARQSRGWTRVVNPGAARREYMAEVRAREQREREAGPPAEGEQES